MLTSPVIDDLSRDPGSDRLGSRLRHLRAQRDLTIAQLAQKAGVSSGMISQIERGNANPSIKTLQRLRAALGVNLWEFLDEAAGLADAAEPSVSDVSEFVRREASRQRIVVGKTQLVKELLSPRNDRNLRFMLITLPPGGKSEDVIIGPGEKGGLVTEGRVRLTVDGAETDLLAGDSFQFPSSVPHTIANPFPAPAKVVWIMSVVESHI